MSLKSGLQLLSVDELLLNMNITLINNLYLDVQISDGISDIKTLQRYGDSRLLGFTILGCIEDLFNKKFNLIVKNNITKVNWNVNTIQNIIGQVLNTINNLCITADLLNNASKKSLADGMKYIITVITSLHDRFILPIINRNKLNLFNTIKVSPLHFTDINFNLLPQNSENIEIFNNINVLLNLFTIN